VESRKAKTGDGGATAIYDCERCDGTGLSPSHLEEYRKAGYTNKDEKDKDGYNILKCRLCKGTGKVDALPLFYEVVDNYNGSRHMGEGIMARVKTRKEADALIAIMDKNWDGCEGTFNLSINPVYEKQFGLGSYAKRLCLHEWSEKLQWGEVHRCRKCGRGIREEYLRRNSTILPKYDGIGYWDEKTGQMVYPDEDRSNWQRSI
jgi:hypothetical protein